MVNSFFVLNAGLGIISVCMYQIIKMSMKVLKEDLAVVIDFQIKIDERHHNFLNLCNILIQTIFTQDQKWQLTHL